MPEELTSDEISEMTQLYTQNKNLTLEQLSQRVDPYLFSKFFMHHTTGKLSESDFSKLVEHHENILFGLATEPSPTR